MMQTYLVGGAIRDHHLGRRVVDRDYVVVGATPQQMIDMGFKQVGSDFPVFLDEDGEEYALARTERKTGKGYYGFETNYDPNVTIEDDLYRRDLTINAMAFPVDHNHPLRFKSKRELVDPYGGLQDLQDGILRHVSEAFVEDPIRVLRVARFAARYGFEIANETKDLMKQMVQSGELNHLVPERVWMECTKAISEQYPGRFFWILRNCGAMEVLFPELESSLPVFNPILSKATLRQVSPTDLLTLLFVETTTQDADQVLERYGASNTVTTRVHDFHKVLAILEYTSDTGDWIVNVDHVLDVLYAIKAFQHPERLFNMVKLVDLLRRDRFTNRMDCILRVFHTAKHITFNSLPDEQRSQLKGSQIGQAIRDRQREATKKLV